MAAPRVDGAMIVPQRVNQPKATPPAKRSRDDSSVEVTSTVETTGWSSTEQAYKKHEIGLRRKNRWSAFQGRQQPPGWANAPTQPGAWQPHGPLPFRSPDRMLGEPPVNYFMRFSAALNEYYRAHGDKVGVATYGFTPDTQKMSPLFRRRPFRREFKVT